MLLDLRPDTDAAGLAGLILSHALYKRDQKLTSTDMGLQIGFSAAGGATIQTIYPPVRASSIGANNISSRRHAFGYGSGSGRMLCILTHSDLEDIARGAPGVAERLKFDGIAGIGRAVQHLLEGTND